MQDDVSSPKQQQQQIGFWVPFSKAQSSLYGPLGVMSSKSKEETGEIPIEILDVKMSARLFLSDS